MLEARHEEATKKARDAKAVLRGGGRLPPETPGSGAASSSSSPVKGGDGGGKMAREAIIRMKQRTRDPGYDVEDAVNTANALHKTLMEKGLPISQEGYAKAASILHRKAKTSAPRVIQGMQQLSAAFLVLQAGARGFLLRLHRSNQHLAHKRLADGAQPVLVDFLISNMNRTRMTNGILEIVDKIQAATKIASMARGMHGRKTIAEMLAAKERVRNNMASRVQNARRGSVAMREGMKERNDKAANILVKTLKEYKRLKETTKALRDMFERMQPIVKAVRRRRMEQRHKQMTHAVIVIARHFRGKNSRMNTQLIKARAHARRVHKEEAAASVLQDVLIVQRNQRIMTTQARQIRMAASQAKLYRKELERASAQTVAAKHARARAARKEVERRRALRNADDADRNSQWRLAGDVHDDLFAPLAVSEYFGHSPRKRGGGSSPSNNDASPSPVGGHPKSPIGSMRISSRNDDMLPPAPFEGFDETLTEQQLATLDALAGMGVGFLRTENAVRGAQGLAFYCYRGRATPAQFPQLPASHKGSSPGGASAAASQLAMETRLRHEMRGIAVHRPTRRLLCRPYHKFWHLGQRPEQLAQEVLELSSAPALPLIEKLDGVMVQGFMVDGRVYLATRSGRTNAAVEAETLLRGEEGQRWIRLCAVSVDAGYTPLFEFTSPNLSSSFTNPALTLTALRHRSSGVYLPYSRLATLASRFQVPVVALLGTWSPPAPPSAAGWSTGAHVSVAQQQHELQILVDSIRQAVSTTAAKRHLEGCVLMLPSGLTLKLKTRGAVNPNASPLESAAMSPSLAPHVGRP